MSKLFVIAITPWGEINKPSIAAKTFLQKSKSNAKRRCRVTLIELYSNFRDIDKSQVLLSGHGPSC